MHINLRRILSLIMAASMLICLFPRQIKATAQDTLPSTSTEESLFTGMTEAEMNPAIETQQQENESLTGIQREPVSFYLINSKARAVVDKAVTRVNVSTGQYWYDLWYLNKWTASWNIWGSYWNQEFPYFEFASGAVGYCIQPYYSTIAMGKDRIPVTWDDIVVPYAAHSDGFEEEKAEGISLVMAYGSPNNGDTSSSGCFATAAMIWSIACGYVRSDGTIRDSETPFLAALKNGFWNDTVMYSEIETKYNELLVCLQNHGKIPSFSAGSRAELMDANTITLQYDTANGLYTASVTDTNGVLKYFNYQSSIDGLTFEKSGNTLTIKATPAAAEQLGSGSIINSRGHDISVGPDSVIVWNTEDNDAQAMITMPVAADPVSSYFTLTVPKGNVQILKTTEDGKNLSGWQFGIFSDAGCTSLISGPHTTDHNGSVTVTGLDTGTAWVKEIGHMDAVINAMYTCTSINPQKIAILSGQSAKVSFNNDLRLGACRIIKTATNGGSVAGWHFEVKHLSGTVIGNYVTDSTGIITLDLEPGAYTVTEVLEDNTLWQCITENPQTVTVEAGKTVEITFTNAPRPGEIRIHKVDTMGESLDGVEFLLEWSEDGINWSSVIYSDSTVPQIGGCTTEGLTDGKLVSNKNGFVTFSGLYPTLQYRLTETVTKEGYALLTDYAYEGRLSVENDLTVSLTVVNAEVFRLPETGSSSLALMHMCTLMCQSIGTGAIIYLHRKRYS